MSSLVTLAASFFEILFNMSATAELLVDQDIWRFGSF